MTIEVHPIIGISGPNKSVSLFHTNKNLRNFHWSLNKDVRTIYDNWPEGNYTFVAGYQNGYNKLGITHVIVKNTV